MLYYFWTHSGCSNPDTAGAATFSWVASFASPAELSGVAGVAEVSVFVGSAETASAIASELDAIKTDAIIREMMMRMILPF